MDLRIEGREIRRSVTLSEQLSVNDSSSLRDLLKQREEEVTRLSWRDSLTLESAIGCEEKDDSATSGGDGVGGRTLLDIILQEQEANGVAAADRDSSNSAAWRTLRDHFRLQSDGSASLGQLFPISNPEAVDSGHPSVLVSPSPSDSNLNSELAVNAVAAAGETPPQPQLPLTSEEGNEVINAGEDSDPSGGTVLTAPASEPEEEEEEEPARVSLMALLEQTDRQWSGSGMEGLSLVTAAADAAVEDEAESGGGATSFMCCVCMVRHKGAAFIPCGHTFCRICSRELWIIRGSCPLCNREILEILDIF
ncbi:uncharacterized protein LOC121980865 [Zingiber officinale]|uniref:uncharacterized protein LOC121980865 n=1 Tax=Zingiber officinale TaxID=94328 RepID=UPI001C4C78CF|nr:uncharacterized protein LOC121980865 [Zingiber officinale]XP_042389058.1 uncharacterized protein LOC121980865 [Zingiber officinale]